MKTAMRVSCALLLLCAAAAAHDSEPINTEFAAPFAVGAGNLQFRVQGFRGADVYDLASTEFELGFAPHMQFSVALPVVRAQAPGDATHGVGNLELGYRLLLAGGSERRFSLSINPEATLPIGSERVAEQAYELGAALHLDTNPIRRLWTHTNIGYETPVARFEHKEKLLFYRFAAMYQLRHWVQPVLELVGEHEFSEDVTRGALVPEVIFAPSHTWEIKLGMPLGLTRETPDLGVQFQVTWKFGRGRG